MLNLSLSILNDVSHHLESYNYEEIILICLLALKVIKFQNEFMKPSFLPKYERKIVKISALCSEAHYRATNTSEIY